ncbi:MAG: succinyl-diaminopimelate desuccinylase [Acidimicrobiales bacterium]|jgi:succinyl-diaminopimelate desuccinylase|nr:succinyl-diaminopimelate desuccinylase [Acidimicrobiales bacterium]|tara:strand:- start:1535 stop:2608 length:1074 start_codon:yes stop_codon:yes gene_type:complete
MTDLLALAAELVDIPSVSFDEAAIVAHLEAGLGDVPGLTVDRIGDNLVARTGLGRSRRLILAGHTDTVPGTAGSDGTRARIDGDTLWGLGSADMKGGLAVMLELARSVPEPAVDVTFVFYAREEVAREHSGLSELFAEVPELLEGDVAILGEPTGGAIEAGCQGTMRFEVRLRGTRAHTARPWMGRNAIHRAGALLVALDAYEHREPEVDGCRYREALQAVSVDGGISGNVVPDEAVLQVNHRYAPDRSGTDAEAHVRAMLAPFLDDGDSVELVDHGPAAVPGLGHPLMAGLVEQSGLEVRAKLGWTDVAFFSEHGVPAVNLGPGDPTVAHMADEHLHRSMLEESFSVLRQFLEGGV